MQTQLNGKAALSHTHAATDITSGTLPVVRGGTGANLSSTGGTGQVLKQTTVGGAVSVGALAAGEKPNGIDAAKIGSGTVSSAEFGYLDGVTSSIQTQLNSKAASSHTHAATNITSGTLPVARGGTNLSSIPANRLLGSGSTANTIQAITIGRGLSLSGGTLSASVGGIGDFYVATTLVSGHTYNLQIFSSSTEKAVEFDGEFDRSRGSSVSHPSDTKLQVSTSGVYLVNAQLGAWKNSGTATVTSKLKLNGTDYLLERSFTIEHAYQRINVSLQVPVALDNGDYVEVVLSGAFYLGPDNWFSLTRIA